MARAAVFFSVLDAPFSSSMSRISRTYASAVIFHSLLVDTDVRVVKDFLIGGLDFDTALLCV